MEETLRAVIESEHRTHMYGDYIDVEGSYGAHSICFKRSQNFVVFF